MNAQVLIVDDDREMCTLVRDTMAKHGYEVTMEHDSASALARLDAEPFDTVITDVRLGGESGIKLCRQVHDKEPDVPVILITAFGNMETAIAAIRAGAYDFVIKPVDMEQLVMAVARAARHKALSDEVRRLRSEAANTKVGHLIGTSPPMRKLYDIIGRLHDSDASVLITGESGTGKELVARALHASGNRAAGPFVALNCGAVPPSLLESELFGHVRGAFTDARQTREGMFVEASGGTIFLDEIGEMPQEMQVKLLRVLQEHKVRPLGGTTEIPFDARFVAATNRDIEDEVESGNFREDLYYRINVVRIHVPPLRSRGSDVLILAQHFINDACTRTGKPVSGITSEAAQKLLDYDWPGNVRELENCIERAVALTRHEKLVVDDLPEKIRTYESNKLVIGGGNPEELPTLEEMERRYIRQVLEATSGNKTQAARILGVGRRTLYRKLGKEEAS